MAAPKFVTRSVATWCFILCWVAMAVGCASRGQPLVADRSPVFAAHTSEYFVRRGDTLYSVAWRYGLDVKVLAANNRIKAPYTIYPNQRLRVAPRRSRDVASTSSPTVREGSNTKHSRTRAAGPLSPAVTSPPAQSSAPKSWHSPVTIAPRQKFGARNNGLNYVLANGAVVRAAAAGQVVYAGTGIGGFRELVIIDHGADYLSAYNYHGTARVKEHQKIQVGTPLADIDLNTSADYALHFEIRLRGQPQNPERLLAR